MLEKFNGNANIDLLENYANIRAIARSLASGCWTPVDVLCCKLCSAWYRL